MAKLSSYFKLYGSLTLIVALYLCWYTYIKYRDLEHSNYSNIRVEFSNIETIPQGLQFLANGKTLILYEKYFSNTDAEKILGKKTASNVEFTVRDTGLHEGEIKSLIINGENIVNHADVLRIDQGEVDVFIFISLLSLIVSFIWLPLYKILVWIESKKK
ncbi:MAG: hypothetical protein KKE94_02870 [Gammaproteobacteria bacterium]|nr:hypothetical protein [Gammaproteobacteria bacterium]